MTISSPMAALGLEAPGQPVREDETRKRIYRHFVESIRNGTLVPGAKVPAERQLAIRFATSRAEVRKVMQVLEEDLLIKRVLGSGTYVRQQLPGTFTSVERSAPAASPIDVLEARLAFEPGISDLMVARATSEDFDRIEAAVAHMRECALQEDDRDFKESGYLVEIEIVRATKNPLLIRMYEMLVEARVQAGWNSLRQLTDTRERRDELVAMVQAQVDAMRARDGVKARRIGRRLNLRMVQQIMGTEGQGEFDS